MHVRELGVTDERHVQMLERMRVDAEFRQTAIGLMANDLVDGLKRGEPWAVCVWAQLKRLNYP